MIRWFLVLIALVSLAHGAFLFDRQQARAVPTVIDIADCQALERTDEVRAQVRPQKDRIAARPYSRFVSRRRGRSYRNQTVRLHQLVSPTRDVTASCAVVLVEEPLLVRDQEQEVPLGDPRIEAARKSFAARIGDGVLEVDGYLTAHAVHPSWFAPAEWAKLGVPQGTKVRVIEVGRAAPSTDRALPTLIVNAVALLLCLAWTPHGWLNPPPRKRFPRIAIVPLILVALWTRGTVAAAFDALGQEQLWTRELIAWLALYFALGASVEGPK
jgi:hypothetical protein